MESSAVSDDVVYQGLEDGKYVREKLIRLTFFCLVCINFCSENTKINTDTTKNVICVSESYFHANELFLCKKIW